MYLKNYPTDNPLLVRASGRWGIKGRFLDREYCNVRVIIYLDITAIAGRCRENIEDL